MKKKMVKQRANTSKTRKKISANNVESALLKQRLSKAKMMK